MAIKETKFDPTETIPAPEKKQNIFKRFYTNLKDNYKRRRDSFNGGEKNNWKAWLYLAPVLILMAVFTFYPLINTIVIAFLKDYNYVTGEDSGFTLENFGRVLGLVGSLQDGTTVYRWNVVQGSSYNIFWYTNDAGEKVQAYFTLTVLRYALPNTLFIVFVTVPLSIIIALLIAIGLNAIPAFKKIFQTIFFIPYVTNAIAIGMVFAVVFDYQGIINFLFGLGEHKWIDQGASWGSGMFALCVYIIWSSLPFKILIFLSGLQNIDKQYYDAAKIDAAGKFKTMMHVTVPLLSPQILYIMITSFIGAFKEYSSVVGLFGGSSTGGNEPNMYTIVYYIYDQIGGNVQYGAAAAVLLFIIILIFTGIQMKVSKSRVYY